MSFQMHRSLHDDCQLVFLLAIGMQRRSPYSERNRPLLSLADFFPRLLGNVTNFTGVTFSLNSWSDKIAEQQHRLSVIYRNVRLKPSIRKSHGELRRGPLAMPSTGRWMKERLLR
jgi:hypothetical protein